jgi:8-oxo-dGTP pyrophosphatase MutT (NUDIX family)
VNDTAYGGEGQFDADSVAALLVTAAGMYVLQRRDDRLGVDFPGFVGLFGGGIEGEELPEDALTRELQEELSFAPARLSPFATLIFDERPFGGWCCRRRFFEVPVSPGDIDTMSVSEGQGMDVLDCKEIMQLPAVIPYDLCAILMHRRGITG